ncbi:DUF2461 domain-containing protein [Nonlabens ponticola]|uniref:DUF2461 domain-containing protein n=1 Tax=Nonlabens ponticola TaxID=2496866 RepID=A0A3S9MUW0_9FLAO|nr:DUF2461 domain-containing protein [Nonlabens ponticola]AZQ42962.1 DUF2461 domain-containing protein [Nonlabens ponticola]
MSFNKMFTFLRELQNNNSKDWMDEHRDEYHDVKDWFVSWLNELDEKLAKVHDTYHKTEGKKAVNRINNNLLYHPNKPVYKDHFGAGLDIDKSSNYGDFYIQIGTNGSFIAGGFYKPKKEVLDSIRDAIDYNGEELKKIISKKSFKETFGGLMTDDDKLKTSPKGYSQDHKHIELLRRKSFAVKHDVTQKEIMQSNFQDKCVEIYKEMLPFREYLNKAVTV